MRGTVLSSVDEVETAKETLRLKGTGLVEVLHGVLSRWDGLSLTLMLPPRATQKWQQQQGWPQYDNGQWLLGFRTDVGWAYGKAVEIATDRNYSKRKIRRDGGVQYQHVNKSADRMARSLGQSQETFELFDDPHGEMIKSLIADLACSVLLRIRDCEVPRQLWKSLVKPEKWSGFFGNSLQDWVDYNTRLDMGKDMEGQSWTTVFLAALAQCGFAEIKLLMNSKLSSQVI
ncbi:hypothetical protein Acr_01g0000330 [Actinidia rufa]|uniref:Uncharacterized protein n=1 Tax=Actinidia rufa TaxID=165716 RepID=A0A7J0E141_9ERIC|nr:hypothetical protein Acr_01g0000330 [Actinidia rufa]